MFFEKLVKTVLFCFCISWLLGTNSISLAGDTDLYGTGRGGNTTAEPPSTSNDKSTDIYGVGRGGSSSRTVPPVTPDKGADTYGGTKKFPAADRVRKLDGEGDLYSREMRAENVILVINRPPNIQGLTGLMVMNSAFTQPAGTLAVGGSVLFEDSDKPNYHIIQAPITLTLGITDTIEAGIKMKYVDYDIATPKAREGGLGDSEVAVKWRWKTHSATSPELAIGLAGILPTGSDSKGLNDVTHWGAKFMVMASSETRIFSNSFLGLYVEAQAVYIDGVGSSHKTITQDKYGVLNAGVLLPISTDNRLQAMIELNDTLFKRINNTPLAEGDQIGITPALRYVTKTLNFTAGAQFLHKDTKGYEDSIRWIGTVSYRF
jgi:hypothetical protein